MYTITPVTVFNKRYNREDRTESYYPTVIYQASYMESKGVERTSSGYWSDVLTHKIRIPVDAGIQNGRSYVRQELYAGADPDTTWTLQEGAIVLIGVHDTGVMTMSELDSYIRENGLRKIMITTHADNTVRGSMAVRHWRVEGK